MIEVKVKAQLETLRAFINRFDKLKIGPTKLIRDIRKLGEGCYKYLKTIIPISRLNKPHLRNNFKIDVIRQSRNILLDIYPNPESQFWYAAVLDEGATIPTRFPRSKKAMRFTTAAGATIFTKRARGFTLKGIGFVDKGEEWLVRNVDRYVDLSLERYLI